MILLEKMPLTFMEFYQSFVLIISTQKPFVFGQKPLQNKVCRNMVVQLRMCGFGCSRGRAFGLVTSTPPPPSHSFTHLMF